MAEKYSGDGVIAFLLGGIIGGALGLLLAPRKGEETRELLADWLEEYRVKTGEFLEEKRELLAEQKEKLEEKWEEGKDALSRATHSKRTHTS